MKNDELKLAKLNWRKDMLVKYGHNWSKKLASRRMGQRGYQMN